MIFVTKTIENRESTEVKHVVKKIWFVQCIIHMIDPSFWLGHRNILMTIDNFEFLVLKNGIFYVRVLGNAP